MYSLATIIKDTEEGPTVFVLILNEHGFPILELTEAEWKHLVDDSWKMLSTANSKLFDLANKGRYKVDPFSIIIDKSCL